MRSPSKPQTETVPCQQLEMLTSLGFGPDTVLMNDPKLFVDGRFLASLLVELHDKLGPQKASLALFQIGLLHGLRDAARVCSERADLASDAAAAPNTTSVVMQWTGGVHMDEAGALSLEGAWPERHEAVARVSKLGAPESPSCWISAGYTTGWLSGTLNRHLVAREVSCAARGDEACRFEVQESSALEANGDQELQSFLREVPFDAFRKVATIPPIERNDGLPNPNAQFDRSQSVVNIWGPVMVLPFTTLDEALGTVEMLGRDPGISEIRVVVVDLRGRPLDEGFGAAALEQILETIESWNAQSLITGVSPESEAAMESIEASHLILRKDLTQAIATAFQIADAQKHLL
jgi:predicted hydrocarbon binding protein